MCDTRIRRFTIRRGMANLVFVWLMVVAAGCSGGGDTAASPPSTPGPSTSSAATNPAVATPSRIPRVNFPTDVFAGIDLDPVDADLAAALQSALDEMAAGGGTTATVMTPSGTWSGASGAADDVTELEAESQFGIASVTKTIVAAQVMQLVEMDELDLDASVSGYLPQDFAFDTNGATIRQLLSHRSGIPDYYSDAVEQELSLEPSRVWTLPEVLDLVSPYRAPTDSSFGYADPNFFLLGLAIEQVRGQPLAQVLRAGVLQVEGADRLIYQPAEAPTDPKAMPRGRPRAALDEGKGYLPSISVVSAAGAAAAMASDSPSLARWWWAFCAGEIVSRDSLTEMATFFDGEGGYGLGVFNPAHGYAKGIGRVGSSLGYSSWAGCLTDKEAVVVVLTTQSVDNQGAMARPLVDVIGR
ncbi:MAG: serine hydrolase [Actinomycetales bacterium]|nr:serine hydrolase [Actinomycetales bacterium]